MTEFPIGIRWDTIGYNGYPGYILLISAVFQGGGKGGILEGFGCWYLYIQKLFWCNCQIARILSIALIYCAVQYSFYFYPLLASIFLFVINIRFLPLVDMTVIVTSILTSLSVFIYPQFLLLPFYRHL